MESDPYSRQILLFFLLLVLSAFFSGTETAFFSINNLLSKRLRGEKTPTSNRILKLLRRPRRLLITILIGNTLVNVTAASVATFLTTSYFAGIGFNATVGLLVNIVVVTFLILVVSEITPKVIAVKSPVKYAKRVSPFILVFYYLLLPVTTVIDKIMDVITTKFGLREQDKERLLESDEFQMLLDIGEQEGTLEEDEKEMLNSIFEFGATSVREIMVPRTDVVCAPMDISMSDLVNLIETHGHTRIPVFRESIDEIIGVINAKDLLPEINQNESTEIKDLARPTIFVPESKKIDDLLRLFQQERQHMAIVVDEYGGTSGIVTLEDVIEEIVGEIRDEYDQESSLYSKVDQNTLLVDAKIDVESLNELIRIEIPQDEQYETLGGFVLEQTGELPLEGESIRYGDYTLTMKRVMKNRIVQVRIRYEPELEPSDSEKST